MERATNPSSAKHRAEGYRLTVHHMKKAAKEILSCRHCSAEDHRETSSLRIQVRETDSENS